MVRRSLIAMAFLAVATPLAAQNPAAEPPEWQWTSDRPDATAPLGVFGSRVLEAGEIEISYRWHQTDYQGIWFRKDSLPLTDVLNLYNDVPLTKKDIRHEARVAFGVTDRITLIARGEFAEIQRETFANSAPIRTTVQELGDVEVGALVSMYASGPYRLQGQVGGVIPTGKSVTYADTTRSQTGTPVTLPYDMRTGSGSFGVIVGVSGSVQNEVGSIGAQFRYRSNLNENDAGFKLGDSQEASAWAAYVLNSVFSISAGARWESWQSMEGQDASLNFFGDPHNAAGLLSGERAYLPLGVNMVMPTESGFFAGHRVQVEAVYTLHHDMDAPQLGVDWAFNFGYTVGLF
jgi:hypothetical protein